MITRILGVLFSVFVICAVQAVPFPDEPLEAVASYSNTPEARRAVGGRASSVLQDRGIFSVAAGSRGMTLSVPASRAAEARRILAHLVQDEKLELSLLAKELDGRARTITPDEILKEEKEPAK